MSGTSPAFHVSRVVAGGCHWEYHSEVDPLLDKLLNSDGFAYAQLEGLRLDAEAKGGLAAAFGRKTPMDYRAPLDRAPVGVANPPWIGELKFAGKPRPRLNSTSLDWRLYFSEPVEAPGLVVGCGLGYKDPMWSRSVATDRQNDQIVKAMGRFKNYCRGHGYTYIPFPA